MCFFMRIKRTPRKKTGVARLQIFPKKPPISKPIVQLNQLNFFTFSQSEFVVSTGTEVI